MKKKKQIKQKKKVKKRLNKKRLAIFLIIAAVIALSAAYYIFEDQIVTKWYKHTSSFKYHNMTWYKVKAGGLTLYATKLAVYEADKNKTYYYILHIRNDPRSLENIPVNIQGKLKRKTFISFDKGPLKCNETVLAAWKLGEFIDAIGLKKEGAFASPGLAIGTPYENMTDKIRNCSDANYHLSVVLLTDSKTSMSQIYQEDYCYHLEIGSCDDVVKTAERFILALIDLMRLKKTIA